MELLTSNGRKKKRDFDETEKASRRKTELENKVNWLEFPDDLKRLIREKFVNIRDYIRFGAVYPSCLVPLLMVPAKIKTECKTMLYSLSGNKVCDFRLPEVPYKGSTQGWLVAVREQYYFLTPTCREDNFKISLLNPFLSLDDNNIKLPTLKSIEVFPEDGIRNFFTPKVLLSSNPNSNPDYTVIAIYGKCRRLAFFKHGDKGWTKLDSKYDAIMDVIYYRDQFYVINEMGAVFAFDLSCSVCPMVSVVIPAPRPPPSPSKVKPERKYLAILSGELLQIVRSRRRGASEEYETTGFEVVKLDRVRVEWVEVKSLDGHMLLLGDNATMSLSASDFPGCDPNCIYFTSDYYEGQHLIQRHDIGMFNLEDGMIERRYEIEPKNFVLSPVWIVPSV